MYVGESKSEVDGKHKYVDIQSLSSNGRDGKLGC